MIKRWYIISYINAHDILPKELIEQIQEYVEGEAIYIPRSVGRSEWGSHSGMRNELDKRNREIREDHKNGSTVAQLSLKYCLCCDSIRKILKKT